MQAALPLIGIVAAGWVLIVIGFGIATNSKQGTNRNQRIPLPSVDGDPGHACDADHGSGPGCH